MTRHYAVLGSPIEHSKSPQIHEYLIGKTRFDADYSRFEVAEDLRGFLNLHAEFSGFSLTMPLKEQAFELSATKDADADATGAVNTLVSTTAGWSGFNTDVAGIRNAIGYTPSSIAVIGSGATAQSALQAFSGSTKYLFARNLEQARVLGEKFGADLVSFDKALQGEVVVSTVPQGVLPALLEGKSVPGVLLDCVYTNPEQSAGKYISGLSMLIHQAVIQQRIFQTMDASKPLESEAELVSGLFELLGMAK